MPRKAIELLSTLNHPQRQALTEEMHARQFPYGAVGLRSGLRDGDSAADVPRLLPQLERSGEIPGVVVTNAQIGEQG